MAVQLSLERCGVVLLDRSRGGTAPGSQPQRSPTSATDCDSDPPGLTMDGQSRTNGQQALKIVQWNAEGVWLKKTELQHFLKLKAIDVCCIQETHLSSSHRFFIRGYEVFRQDRENRPKEDCWPWWETTSLPQKCRDPVKLISTLSIWESDWYWQEHQWLFLASIHHLISRSSYTTSK